MTSNVLCKDCRHCAMMEQTPEGMKPVHWAKAECVRARTSGPNPVTGELVYEGGRLCCLERLDAAGQCGPHGMFFAPKHVG